MNKKLEALLKKKEVKDVQEVIYDKLEEWQEAEYRGLSDILGIDIVLIDFCTCGSDDSLRHYVVYADNPLTLESKTYYANISSKWIIDQLKRAQKEMIFPCRGRFEEKDSVNGMTYYILK